MYALDDYAMSPTTIVRIPGHLIIEGKEATDALCKQEQSQDTVNLTTTLG